MTYRRPMALGGGLSWTVRAVAAFLCISTRIAVADSPVSAESEDRSLRSVIGSAEWARIDRSIERGLSFLSTQQASDGSFQGHVSGQPAVTSLCVMAFLSRGHVPNEGPYGTQITRAIDYVLGNIGRADNRYEGVYNHAICGLMLTEVYGMTEPRQRELIRRTVQRELAFSRQYQISDKRNDHDYGGWRYLHQHGPNDSDLSATSWQLMFLRSARNAEFDVPAEYIDDAMRYVRRCFDTRLKAFTYALIDGPDREHYASRGVVGGGIVSLAMGGEHGTPMARQAGEWVLQQSFEQYNSSRHPEDRYHYSAYYCSQAMFQLGGRYWSEFYPGLARVLVAHQRPNGFWDEETVQDAKYGNAYTTALSVLALTPPYQILPIYQR